MKFRVVKWIIPLFLLYTIPRLFEEEEQYSDLFKYIFPVAFFALFAQLFTISIGISPAQFFGAKAESRFAVDVASDRVYRGFYSGSIILMTILGALYHIAFKRQHFSSFYLYAIVAANALSTFLSATRGWVVGVSFILFSFFALVSGLNPKRLALASLLGVALVFGAINIPMIGKQVENATKRMMTLEALAGGDVTAGGTLKRLSKRSPRVVNKWMESPLTGWGFSDVFFDYRDPHVGNQTILMHSGIIGAFLLFLFFSYFLLRMWWASGRLRSGHPYKQVLLIFIIFFIGWFLIHSSSAQRFAFYLNPESGMIVAMFFSFGALLYRNSLKPKSLEE